MVRHNVGREGNRTQGCWNYCTVRRGTRRANVNTHVRGVSDKVDSTRLCNVGLVPRFQRGCEMTRMQKICDTAAACRIALCVMSCGCNRPPPALHRLQDILHRIRPIGARRAIRSNLDLHIDTSNVDNINSAHSNTVTLYIVSSSYISVLYSEQGSANYQVDLLTS